MNAPLPIFLAALALAARALPAMSDTPAPGAPPVPPYTLPDPLLNEDGARVLDAASWRGKRRPALLRLFESEVYGLTPIGRPASLRFVLRQEKKNARDGRATRLRIGVLFEGTESGRQMELLVYLPNQVRGPAPLFLGLNFDGNYSTTDEPDIPLPAHWINGLFLPGSDHRAREENRGRNAGMFPLDLILERGYAIATAGYSQIEPDEPGRASQGPRGLPTQAGAGQSLARDENSGWGALGAWAWGLSRAMDYLQTNPRVDSRRVALFGFSRLGKAALWAGAQDERFAMVVSQNAGKGGVSLSKRLVGEPVAHLSGPGLGHWFAPSYKKYAGNEAALPVDGHTLAALIAPRPLLVLSGTEDAWSDPEGEFEGILNADPVYRLLGSDGLAQKSWPAPQVLVGSTLGYYLRPGGHNVTLEDWQATLFFADRHLRAGAAIPSAP